MIEKFIIDYLAAHKRLVVPQLGAFIVKQPDGKIIFSELLKRDDGVLRGLLCAQGMTEVQAMAVINRLVFDVRDAVGRGDRFEVQALGAFYPAPNHTIRFVDAQSLRAAAERAAADADTEPGNGAENGAAANVCAADGTDAERGTGAGAANGGRAGTESASGSQNGCGDANGADGGRGDDPERASRRATALSADERAEDDEQTCDNQDDTSGTDAAENTSRDGGRENRTPRPRRPDPAVRGLRYGDPMRRRSKGAVDKFLIIAIAVALIAVGIIAYVYVSGQELERDKAELLAPDAE